MSANNIQIANSHVLLDNEYKKPVIEIAPLRPTAVTCQNKNLDEIVILSNDELYGKSQQNQSSPNNDNDSIKENVEFLSDTNSNNLQRLKNLNQQNTIDILSNDDIDAESKAITEESIKNMEIVVIADDESASRLFNSEEIQNVKKVVNDNNNNSGYNKTTNTIDMFSINKQDNERLYKLYTYIIQKWFVKEVALMDVLFSSLCCTLSHSALHCSFFIQTLNQLRNQYAQSIKSDQIYSQLTMSFAAVFSKAAQSLRETSNTSTDLSIKTLNNALTMTMTYKNSQGDYIISQPIFSLHPLLTDTRFWQLLYYDLVDTQYHLAVSSDVLASESAEDIMQLEQIKGAQLMYIIHTMRKIHKDISLTTEIVKKLIMCQAFSKPTKELLHDQISMLFNEEWANQIFNIRIAPEPNLNYGVKQKSVKQKEQKEKKLKPKPKQSSLDTESIEERLKLISLMTGYSKKSESN